MEPRDEGGTHATMTLRFAGPLARLVIWALRERTERYLALEAAGLKERSEGLGYPRRPPDPDFWA